MLPGERELRLLNYFVLFSVRRFALCERQTTDQVGALPVCDELAATCTAALLDTLITKKVAVAWRAAEQLASSGLLEAFSDGFACFLHEKLGKERETIAFSHACKGEKPEI